ncbi:MAG: hypothetical protein PHO41_01320 [Eubacteriales bacterium]|nr:hypothetical protein [Eubacteriales bacterium]
MSIESINNTGYQGYTQSAGQAAKAAPAATESKTDAVSAALQDQDSFEKTESTKDVGYENLKAKAAKMVDTMTQQRYDSLQRLVAQMFGDQASAIMNAKSGLKDAMAGIISSLENPEAASIQAQSAIAEDGEFGVNAVATRIMDMAVSLSGGDTGKITMLKNAVEKGFKEAGAAWGDELPEISGKTYDEVMKRFDYWEKTGSMEGYTMGGEQQEKDS